MGEMEVPFDAYYGAGTARAVLNFPISERRFNRRFIATLGLIKQFAAEVNHELGLLDQRLADAISRAAREVVVGKLDRWFVVDVFQTGSGTSTNMNANEVIANRAAELLGAAKGARHVVHPNDHVNLGQSSNDVFPTAMQVAAARGIRESLLPALEYLERMLRYKSDELWPLIKTGRTHLQDAMPIRLGQEFLGYAGQLDKALAHCTAALEELAELPLGGTAVGTGAGTHPEFASRVASRLSADTGIPFAETDKHFSAQATLDTVVSASSALRGGAIALFKIASDIRLLASGPRAGIGEISLPAVQPGSSMMPGKVNPVVAESLTMVCAQVIGNDASIAFAGAAGSQLELNVMMPIAAHCLLDSIELLSAASRNFTENCVSGIRATDRGPALVSHGLMTVSALVPAIGYDAAAAIAHEAHASGRTIHEVARERTTLSDQELLSLLDPTKMTSHRGEAAD